MTFKKRDLHIIPTNDKHYHDIKIGRHNKMFSESEVGSQKYMNNEPVKHYHIYITSDEDIKKDDWYLDTFDNKIRQAFSDIVRGSAFFTSSLKIIATSDKSINIMIYNDDEHPIDGNTILYPQIPRDFIDKLMKKHNKGQLVRQVLVEYIKEETEPMSYVFTEKLKVRYLDNTINIDFLKESWTREEVETELKYCVAEIAAKLGHAGTSDKMKIWNDETNEWIKENI